MRIKVDDIVQVITGDDAGQRARVISVDGTRGKIVVEGVNRVYKHVRRSQRNPQGGRLSKEMPIDASNVLLVCEKCNEATRVGLRYESDGSKVRCCKSCSAALDTVSPPRSAHSSK